MECATELRGFIRRIQGNIFYSRFSFELIIFSLNIFYEFSYVSIDAMYFSCNVSQDSSSCSYSEFRDERKLNAFVYVSFSKARAYTLSSATTVLTI